MIKDNPNYLYLIVPNEYRCVYYNILDTLGTLGEDLLTFCTATCKGRAINGLACYNMFNAACACYYLGLVKRARTLISYIKAQLDISCDKNITFENSSNDEFLYLSVPKRYECIFGKLLEKLAKWGQDLLDDCTSSCKGDNKNVLNSWNLLRSVIIAYNNNNKDKADRIADYINLVLQFSCPSSREIEPPELSNLILSYEYNQDNNALTLLGGTVNVENKENIINGTMKLVNSLTGEVLVSNIPVKNTFDLGKIISIGFNSTISFQLQVEGVDKQFYSSDVYVIKTPTSSDVPYETPVISNFEIIYSIDTNIPTINIQKIKYNVSNPENLQYKSAKLINAITNEVIVSPIDTNGGTININVAYNVQYGTVIPFKLEAVDINNNVIESNIYNIQIPANQEYPIPQLEIVSFIANVNNENLELSGVRAKCINPSSISNQGLTLTLRYGEENPIIVAQNVPASNQVNITFEPINITIPPEGIYVLFQLYGYGLNGESYSTSKSDEFRR